MDHQGIPKVFKKSNRIQVKAVLDPKQTNNKLVITYYYFYAFQILIPTSKSADFFFFFNHTMCGILVPLARNKTDAPWVEAQSPNH